MISVDNIYKSYKNNQILKGASFIADEGQLISLIGKNGSGKSTLLQIVAGCMKPDSGTVSINSYNTLDNKKMFAELIGYVPQDNPLLENLSVYDNLKFWTPSKNKPDEAIIDYFELMDLKKVKISTLSGGMKRRLSIACALQKHPKIIIMDEPTAALDIYYQTSIRDWIKDFRNNNGTVIISSHNEAEIMMSDAVYLLTDGITKQIDTKNVTMNEIRNYFLNSNINHKRGEEK